MDTSQITYAIAQPDEYGQILALVRRVFDQTTGQGQSEAGHQTFYAYLDPEAYAQRQQTNHFTQVAKDGERVVGVLEIRDFQHIALMFVDPEYQKRGIARTMLNLAIEKCREHNQTLDHLSVNSAVNACPVYAHLGFVADGGEQEKDGLRFTKMHLPLSTS